MIGNLPGLTNAPYMKTLNLKARILIPLVLVSGLVLTALVVELIIEENEHIGEDFSRSVKALQRFYQTALKEHAHKLEAALDVITNNVEIRTALKAADREGMLASAQPLFQRLKAKHGITHFYFHSPRRVNLVRIHQPDRYGDTIDRFTLLAAEKSGEMSHGVELGPLGTFTLRAVAPVHEGGRLLGYIELGEEVNSLVADMAHMFVVELVVTIDKRFLKRAAWEAGMRMLERETKWDYLPNTVIVSSTLSVKPTILRDLLIQSADDHPPDGIAVMLNDRFYRAAFVTLRDTGDQEVGQFLVLRDMTSRINNNYMTIYSIGASAVILGILILVFFYWFLDRTEQQLQLAEIHSARLGRILEHSWNEIYTFSAETFRFIEVSDGACQNLGYSLDEMRKLRLFDLNPEFTSEQFDALIRLLHYGEKQTATFETTYRRKDGTCYPAEVRLQFSSIETPPVFIAISQDVTERKRYIAELEHKALYDALTDLPNRFLLQDKLEHALEIARRETSPLAVVMIDILRLHEINDLLGHQNGDLVLQEVAGRLQKLLRKFDTLARLGGDEFALVLPAADSDHVSVIAEKIKKLFEKPVHVEDTSLEVEVNIGFALYPEHGEDSATLLQHTDIAMRVAKNEAGGLSIYNPGDDPFCLRRLKLHGELRQAINEKMLALYFQPKIDLKTNRVVGVEALARWPHPVEGMIPPSDFIPMVEQSGMIRPFTLWVIEHAIEQCKHCLEAGIDMTIAINLSTRNLLDPNLPGSIAELLESHKVSPESLSLEITESAIMARPENALKIIAQLHDMGLKLSIDDFGTGYSSLAYLKKLPVQELKIDKSFVSGLIKNDNDAVIVRSTIDLAHNLGLVAVAEGVENQETLDKLAILNCDIVQGFHISRPMTGHDLDDWLINSPWGPRN